MGSCNSKTIKVKHVMPVEDEIGRQPKPNGNNEMNRLFFIFFSFSIVRALRMHYYFLYNSFFLILFVDCSKCVLFFFCFIFHSFSVAIVNLLFYYCHLQMADCTIEIKLITATLEKLFFLSPFFFCWYFINFEICILALQYNIIRCIIVTISIKTSIKNNLLCCDPHRFESSIDYI